MTDMNDLSENLGRIAESNERSAESLLQIQRMIFVLVVLVIPKNIKVYSYIDKSKFNESKYLNLFKHIERIVSLNELFILSGKYLTAIYA